MSEGATMQLKERLEKARDLGERYGAGDFASMASALLAILLEHEYEKYGSCQACVFGETDGGPCPTVKAIEQAMGEGDK